MLQESHYEPCDHPGVCSKETGCKCVREGGLMCQSYCGCKGHCLYSFPGCLCKSENDCSNKSKCICAQMDRECDPNKCKGCKSHVN
jgi:hypothetical protein